jgi:acyl dehydratase
MSPAVMGPEELEAKVGSRVRLGATLTSLEAFDGGRQATLNCVFEVEGSSKPSCVADDVFRYYD